MRNMSFALTKPQFLDGTKDVTRRLGWRTARPGQTLCAVEKGMGLKKGEKVVRLGTIELLNVNREPLSIITPDDVRREGFPDLSPREFVEMFCDHNNCTPRTLITRIVFRRLT
jgi:hypothetical protein